MNAQKIHYCFTLSEDQMKYLRSKKYKIDRMECFLSLVELAERETKHVQISKVQQVEILPGQVMVDNIQLAKLWDKDRKTVPKLIKAMEALGISSSQKVGDNRIHTLHALSGWYVDGKLVKNPFATKRNADDSAIVTAVVPPAKVFTIEVSDDKNIGEEGPECDSDNSQTGNVGMIQSADLSVSHTSSPSNDNGDVGKSVTEIKSSDSSLDYNSPQSADIPSSRVEADGSQNGGNRNDESSAQQEGQSLNPNSTSSDGNGYYSQMSNGYSNPNGFHSNE